MKNILLGALIPVAIVPAALLYLGYKRYTGAIEGRDCLLKDYHDDKAEIVDLEVVIQDQEIELASLTLELERLKCLKTNSKRKKKK